MGKIGGGGSGISQATHDAGSHTGVPGVGIAQATHDAGSHTGVPGVGADPAPWVLLPDSGAAYNTFQNIVANSGVIMPALLTKAATITGIRLRVGAGGAFTMSVALYDEALNRVATSGSVAVPATGPATINFTAPYAAAAGRYHLGISVSSATPTFATPGGVSNVGPVSGKDMLAAHPLPAVFVPATADTPFSLVGIISGGWVPIA